MVLPIQKSFNTFVTVALLDVRHLCNRISNWLLLLVLCLVLVISLFALNAFHYFNSLSGTYAGIVSPAYALGGYDASLFYGCVLVGLVLTLRLSRYDEPVVENVQVIYRNTSNFTLTFARVLVPTLLLALVLAGLALVYQILATTLVRFGPRLLEPLEPWSLVYLWTNVTLSLFFWVCLANMIAEMFKRRTAALVMTFGILAIQMFVSPLLPGETGSFTFGYGAANLFVSKIAPDYFHLEHILYWISLLCLSLAIVTATSMLSKRLDQARRTTYRPLAIVLVSVGIVCQVFVHSGLMVRMHSHQQSILAYDQTFRNYKNKINIESISGEVSVDPGSNLSLDLSYVLELQQLEQNPFSSDFSASLILNPGIRVLKVSCEDEMVEYDLTHGILHLDLSPCTSNTPSKYEFRIHASGVPIPDYLVDYIPLNDPESIHPQLVKLLGQRSSIFKSNYVALLPNSYWYPRPPQLATTLNISHTALPTKLNLNITLRKQNWTALTSFGQVYSVESNADPLKVLANSSRPLSLTASHFHVRRQPLDDIDLELVTLSHRSHWDKIERNNILVTALASNIEKSIRQLNALDVSYPYKQFFLIEKPSTLSLVNRDRDLAKIGNSILYFSEFGLPNARSDRIEPLENASREATLPQYKDLYEHLVSTLKDDYWLSSIFDHTVQDVIVNSVMNNNIEFHGRQQEVSRTISRIFLMYSLSINESSMGNDPTNFTRFDFNIANYIAEQSQLHIPLLYEQLRLGPRLLPRIDLNQFRVDYLSSHGFWQRLEQSASNDFETKNLGVHQFSKDVSLLEKFREVMVAELTMLLFDQEDIAGFFSGLGTASSSKTISLDDISRLFDSVGFELDEVLNASLFASGLPGVRTSVARQARVEDDAQSHINFRTVLDLRNAEETSGLIAFAIVEYQPVSYENLTYKEFVRHYQIGPYSLEGNTSYQLVVNSEDSIGYIESNSFLSRNRGKFAIPVQSVSENQVHSSVDAPFARNSYFVRTDWNPDGLEDNIIVDDLDPGFKAPKRHPFVRVMSWRPRSQLFRKDYFEEEGYDNGLPITFDPSSPKGTWARAFIGSACWGRYRHTYAIADTSKRREQNVAFESVLPSSGSWDLYYHYPDVSEWFLSAGEYHLRVEVGEQVRDIDVEVSELDTGWNQIGTFEVSTKANSRVTISSESQCEYVFADAIKWSRSN